MNRYNQENLELCRALGIDEHITKEINIRARAGLPLEVSIMQNNDAAPSILSWLSRVKPAPFFDKYLMIVDVESIGLYGPPFAVGYVVVDTEWNIKDRHLYSVGLDYAIACCENIVDGSVINNNFYYASKEDMVWALDNLPYIHATHTKFTRMYERFWTNWINWKCFGAVMCADCPYPVETNFLRECIMIDRERASDAPYPLYDVASVVAAAGGDPLATYNRLWNELPAHNPLADVMQSVRILKTALLEGEVGLDKIKA